MHYKDIQLLADDAYEARSLVNETYRLLDAAHLESDKKSDKLLEEAYVEAKSAIDVLNIIMTAIIAYKASKIIRDAEKKSTKRKAK